LKLLRRQFVEHFWRQALLEEEVDELVFEGGGVLWSLVLVVLDSLSNLNMPGLS